MGAPGSEGARRHHPVDLSESAEAPPRSQELVHRPFDPRGGAASGHVRPRAVRALSLGRQGRTKRQQGRNGREARAHRNRHCRARNGRTVAVDESTAGRGKASGGARGTPDRSGEEGRRRRLARRQNARARESHADLRGSPVHSQGCQKIKKNKHVQNQLEF